MPPFTSRGGHNYENYCTEVLGGFQNPYNQNPYNHNPYCVGILIGFVGILIGSVGILIGFVGILIGSVGILIGSD